MTTPLMKHTLFAAVILATAGAPTWAQKAENLETAAAEKGAVVSKTGLVYRLVKAGDGAQPNATDKVRVHYRGTFTNGKEFDSSYQRGKPAEFPLNRVIPCWTEGLQLMKVGGKAKLTCPASTAYGSNGSPGGAVPPDSVLNFEVELLGIAPR